MAVSVKNANFSHPSVFNASRWNFVKPVLLRKKTMVMSKPEDGKSL